MTEPLPTIPVPLAEAPSASEMRSRAREFYERMATRRSVRSFAPDPVPLEVLEDAIRAAGTAPNGANHQPWHFTVVTDPEIRAEIRRRAEEEERAFYGERAPRDWLDALAPLGTDADKPFLEIAPALIAIFAQSWAEDEEGGRRKNYYVTESVGIATGMLITALHTAGLATLTHTPSPMKFLNEVLERPENERPFLLLVVGHPAADARVPDITKKPLSDIASFR